MISVVTVSWNSQEDIQALLSSLDLAEAKEAIEFIVVDNNSNEPTKDSLRALKAHFIGLNIIFNSENLGFGTACNIGVRSAKGNVILFLNPDTKVDLRTVLEAAERVRQSNEFDILGVQQISDLGVTRTCCRPITKLNTIISCSGLNKISKFLFRGFEMIEWDHLQSRNVGHVIGAFYCMKRNAFDILNGFDEKFFLYYEDLDLSVRAVNAGMKIFFDSTLKIYHKGGGSSEKIGVRRIEYSLVSRDFMIGKHFGSTHQALCRMASCFVELPLRAVDAVIKKQFEAVGAFVNIYWKLLKLPLGAE